MPLASINRQRSVGRNTITLSRQRPDLDHIHQTRTLRARHVPRVRSSSGSASAGILYRSAFSASTPSMTCPSHSIVGNMSATTHHPDVMSRKSPAPRPGEAIVGARRRLRPALDSHSLCNHVTVPDLVEVSPRPKSVLARGQTTPRRVHQSDMPGRLAGARHIVLSPRSVATLLMSSAAP